MINLLPPSYKKELQAEEQFRLVLILGMLLVVFFICLSLALLAIRVYIAGQIQAQQILVESQREKEDKAGIDRIQKLNQDIAAVSSFYANRTSASTVIARISNALPESTYLTSLSYTAGAQKTTIALKGFAPRTEDLLALQTSLEKDPLFTNLAIPPSNWARPTDIDFSFEFELQ